jgi:hypothetical protein
LVKNNKFVQDVHVPVLACCKFMSAYIDIHLSIQCPSLSIAYFLEATDTHKLLGCRLYASTSMFSKVGGLGLFKKEY